MTYNYLSGYQPKPLTDQVERLKTWYPELKNAEVTEPGELPMGAEGWFAIPNIWKEVSLLTGNYNDSVKRVLDLIKQDRNGAFYNYCEGQLGPEYLRQSTHTEAIMRKLSEEQGHPDILAIAADFSLQHSRRAVGRSREVRVGQGPYGLGAFAIGVMLLTHPERLQHYRDLYIDCAGDEFDDPDTDDCFGHAVVFEFNSGRIEFDAASIDPDYPDYLTSSAHGFLPQ